MILHSCRRNVTPKPDKVGNETGNVGGGLHSDCISQRVLLARREDSDDTPSKFQKSWPHPKERTRNSLMGKINAEKDTYSITPIPGTDNVLSRSEQVDHVAKVGE